ncbi:hypothetical protein ACFY00_32720 [Kitasatospora sp. NPDC001540]|uniref:hypothetical protein n=1 Tax=Kitasatospora sp. NPDC001540 TaxID=3364014 RepID=UPI00368C9F78
MWTAFGPTNVAIHRISTAMELGDIQIAAGQGPRVDSSTLPLERRVRHTLEIARAYSAQNRMDEALALVLDAKKLAPSKSATTSSRDTSSPPGSANNEAGRATCSPSSPNGSASSRDRDGRLQSLP